MIHVHAWDFKKLNASDLSGFLLIDLLCYWSVPVFVMISGGLLLKPNSINTKEEPVLFLKKRWRRMFRPMIVWGVFATLWGVFALGQSQEETLRRTLLGIPNDPQWFLYMMLGLYLVTPTLRLLILSPGFERKHLTAVISLLYTANLVVLIQQMTGYQEEIEFPINSFLFLDFYLLGMVVSRVDIWSRGTDRCVVGSALLLTVLFAVSAILFPTQIREFRMIFSHHHSPLVLLQAVAIFRSAVNFEASRITGIRLADTKMGNIVRQSSDWSFGIYLIHPFVLNVLFKYVLRPIDGPFLVYSLVIWVLTMIASCLGCYILRSQKVTGWMIPAS